MINQAMRDPVGSQQTLYETWAGIEHQVDHCLGDRVINSRSLLYTQRPPAGQSVPLRLAAQSQVSRAFACFIHAQVFP